METKAAVPSAAPAKPAKVVKAKTSKKTAKPNGSEWAEGYREGTIGRMIAEAIIGGKLNNEAILETVKKAKKGAKTTYGCIAWYKSAARKAGVLEKK